MQEVSSICSHALVRGTIIFIFGLEGEQTKHSVGQQTNTCLLERQNKGQKGQIWTCVVQTTFSPNDLHPSVNQNNKNQFMTEQKESQDIILFQSFYKHI